ncbi:hypothetical protein [Streptomyces sp. SAJ15]|uniref:hypothetical protein n=1 Tax=Streptomyces sp. SAJ15 TaxID=2011095 RepID=UPI0021B2A2FC|nr:hypothetical protein [Streptomyces sp. SAJ15]
MTTRPLPWMPPHSGDIKAQPAGRSWDAVKVPALIGKAALTFLGEDSGAVIADGKCALWYWLVAPGAATDWTLHRVLGKGAYVAVPPADRTEGPGLHWRVPPAPGRCLTEPAGLHAALLAAGHTVKHCHRCDRMTAEPVVVADVHGATGSGHIIHACPACAPHYPPPYDPLAQIAADRRALEGRSR